MKLGGKGAIVTGASVGLGRCIAAAFLREGASVAICGRDSKALTSAADELARDVRPGARLHAVCADVSDRGDVERLVSETVATFGRLDILVNNAAVQGPLGPTEAVDWDDWTKTIRINLLGPALTMRTVLPVFKLQGRGKIINLSGGGATGPRPRASAYAASKAALVRLTETVAEETRGTGIDVNAIAPGALNTRLLEETLAAGPEGIGEREYRRAVEQKAKGGSRPEDAADLCVFLASSESDGITGKLLSAVWDPWRTLASHREQLTTSDIYTLRRIVPADRGQDWGSPDQDAQPTGKS
jgi:NAD(P)-dependent dehydrogenase (short-subunit alcohol dehydrogenase family)